MASVTLGRRGGWGVRGVVMGSVHGGEDGGSYGASW
jgi:hypothetical protein